MPIHTKGLGGSVTSLKRSSLAPEVPTVHEKGFPGYAASTWYGMLTSPGVPLPVVNKLYSTLNKILEEGEIKAQLLAPGFEPMPTSTGEFNKVISKDKDKWANVVKDSNAKH